MVVGCVFGLICWVGMVLGIVVVVGLVIGLVSVVIKLLCIMIGFGLVVFSGLVGMMVMGVLMVGVV